MALTPEAIRIAHTVPAKMLKDFRTFLYLNHTTACDNTEKWTRMKNNILNFTPLEVFDIITTTPIPYEAQATKIREFYASSPAGARFIAETCLKSVVASVPLIKYLYYVVGGDDYDDGPTATITTDGSLKLSVKLNYTPEVFALAEGLALAAGLSSPTTTVKCF
jgi:hypothetical protein